MITSALKMILFGSSIIILCVFKYIAGNYTIVDGDSYTITRENLVTAYQANNYLPVWRFNTIEDHRIRFSFQDFSFYWNDYDYNLLDIGDGWSTDAKTRLATFGGRTLPTDVTSVSNAAWLKVNEPYVI